MATPGILRFCTYDRLLAAVILFAVVLTCGLSAMQTDTWWQLRAGQDMWRSRTVLLTDTYSHTAAGAFWPNHEWLAEVIFYAMYRVGGLGALTLWSAALIAAGWMFTWSLAEGPRRRVFLLTLAALVSSAIWWGPRPHAFSLLFIPMTVFLIARGRLWWLPPVFLVWANAHGGVLLGFVLMAAGFGAQAVVMRKLPRASLLVVAACVVAVTATPLGLSFWTEIPKSLSRINQYTLDEWRRPGLTELAMLPFWLLAVAYCAALVRALPRLRRLTPSEAALHACAVALLPGAVSAVRHVGPFLMIAVPALTALLDDGRQEVSETDPDRPTFNCVAMTVLGLAVVFTLASAYRNQWPRLRWTPFPTGALQALEQCPDNIYNRYDEGGPLLWFAQDRKVFLDGRQDPYPVDLVLAHIETETAGSDVHDLFARHGIRCALLPVSSPTVTRLTNAGWQNLYRDRRWIILAE